MEKNWEYLVERILPKNEAQRLMELGRLGWELITVSNSEERESVKGNICITRCVKYYFKRLKQE